jgi:hypothetical protein
MSAVQYACADELRRTAVEGHPTLNAIDYLEVGDLAPGDLDAADQAEYGTLPPSRRAQLLWQRKLTVHFVNPLTAEQLAGLADENIRISGGERTRDIRADVLATEPDAVVVRATPAGDFSRYTLTLVRSPSDTRPPAGFDPLLADVGFSFKVDCPSDFDCRPAEDVVAGAPPGPEIDYLAKDYASFRRLILDRMALLAPDWKERSAADLGIALVELLAYVGDQLSYRQDAIATEAYIGTSRRRVSARRHALLVDYAMHDGSNARAWLQVTVNADTVLDPAGVAFCTEVPGLGPLVAPGSADHGRALDATPEWFEPVGPPPPLFTDLNELRFYTWGDERCTLPAGATAATLRGAHPALDAGAVLMFEEVKGPATGDPADGDPARRHPVRLTRVVHEADGSPLTDPLDGTAITEIEWDAQDALPFGLVLSSRTADGDVPVENVSVARGNVLLVDHGLGRTEDLGAATARFRPTLAESPLTHAGAADPAAPAAAAVGGGQPAIVLDSVHEGDATHWLPAPDLLNAAGDTPRFVVEIEEDETATLRFGDDSHGRRPLPGETFTARYRVGNGPAGNVGADAIVHVVTLDGRIDAVRNPLPARGGAAPESLAQVRRRAPQAFRTQERAVTPADYEAVAMRDPTVQRAAATLRWTGSWDTVFLTLDRFDNRPLDAAARAGLLAHVDRYRMAGHDVELDEPRFVSLELALFVCVQADYFRADVKRRLLDVLSNRDLGAGRRGLFHPDNFSFGQTIYLSPILAAAHDVPGVASAEVITFQRQGVPERRYIDDGRLPLGRLEIARLDNDPNFPEHGVLRIELRGGK